MCVLGRGGRGVRVRGGVLKMRSQFCTYRNLVKVFSRHLRIELSTASWRHGNSLQNCRHLIVKVVPTACW